ncbi:MAG: hypothetical protein ACI4N4_04945 [Candidatus Fimenecus sp.]
MFKVSLLPASYRKYLEGKKKKELMMKIALIVLLCMLIIYSGFAVRFLVLQSQLKKVERANSNVIAQINELQQYKGFYDSLVLSQDRVNTVQSRQPSAVKFLSIVQAQRPEYVKINSIALTDWSGAAICAIEGELPSAQTIGAAITQLDNYAESFKTNEAYGGVVNQIKVVNDMPSQNEASNGTVTYTFIMYVSLSGQINIDASGSLVTTTTTTTTETTSEESTASDEGTASESSSAEAENEGTTAEQ